MKLAESEMTGENVLYKNILKEDDEGGMTLFVDKIFDLDRMERFAYVREIENTLDAKRYGIFNHYRVKMYLKPYYTCYIISSLDSIYKIFFPFSLNVQ